MTDPKTPALPEPVAMIDEVIAFLVKHGMLDQNDEYSLDDVVGALRDNYEPADTTRALPRLVAKTIAGLRSIVACRKEYLPLDLKLIGLAATQLQEALDRAERAEKERDQLRAGVKRMSDEEELQSETSDGVDLSAAHFAAKLAAAEKELADAERMCDSYADEAQRLHDRATTAEAALAERTDDLTFMQEANAALREDTARALADARKVIEGLARLKVPAKPQGNAGAYSIFHSDIRAASAWLSAHPAKETTNA